MTPTETASPPGVIWGRVTWSDGQVPPRFRVGLFPVGGDESRSGFERRFQASSSGHNRVVVGADDGTFRIDTIPPGAYHLVARDEFGGQSAAFSVDSPGTLGPLAVVVARAAVMECRVRDPSGVPVADADVLLKNASTAEWSRTDEEGRVTVAGIVPGLTRVYAEGGGLLPSEPTWITVEGSTIYEQGLWLRPAFEIVGHLVDERGDAVVDAIITGNADFGRSDLAFPDDEGRFVLRGFDRGPVSILVKRWDLPTSGPHAAWSVWEDRIRIEAMAGEEGPLRIECPSTNPVRVKGVVSVDGATPRNGRVELLDARGNQVKWSEIEEDGSYRIAAARQGFHTLEITTEAARSWCRKRLGTVRVCLPAEPEFLHDIEIVSARLTGRVLGPRGRPLAGVRVFLTRPDERGWCNRSATTTEDGRYTFTSAPGPFHVGVGCPGSLTESTLERIDLRAGETATLDFDLVESGDVVLEVRRARGCLDVSSPGNGIVGWANGLFESEVLLEDLPRGPQKLIITPSLAQETRFWDGSEQRCASVVVNVVPGETTRAVATLARGGKLRVNVLGAPEAVPVLLEVPGIPIPSPNSKGVWLLGPIPPGSYTVRATAGGRIRETTAEVSADSTTNVTLTF